MNLQPCISATLRTHTNPTVAMHRLASFVGDHGGMLATWNSAGVVIQADVVGHDGDKWTEYCSVWSFSGARDALGY